MKKTGKKSEKAENSYKKEVKKVYRSRDDKIIAGVCGGIAEYLDVDSVWIRLVAVLLVFVSGIGLVMYIVAWIIMPKNPKQKQTEDTKAEQVVNDISKKMAKKESESKTSRVTRGRLLAGIILILIGLGLLFRNTFGWFNFNYVWPLIIISIGLFILAGRSK